MKRPTLRPETASPPRWRAIILGLIFGCAGFYFDTYGYQIVQALVWAQTSLPLGGVFVLFLVTLLTGAVGLVARSLRLTRSELLVIFVMTTITGAIGGSGFLAFAIPMLPAGHYYATPQNNYEAFF